MKVLNLFGKVSKKADTIEWQKRDLPHCHNVDWLVVKLQLDQVDDVISTEIPDKESDPELYAQVTAYQVHGPCGQRDPTSPCMKNGKCMAGYPKPYNHHTRLGNDGYTMYRRTDEEHGGRSFEMQTQRSGIWTVTNRDIVPYNPVLMRFLDCHTGVLCANSCFCVRYMCDYNTNGQDMVTVSFRRDEENPGPDPNPAGPAAANPTAATADNNTPAANPTPATVPPAAVAPNDVAEEEIVVMEVADNEFVGAFDVQTADEGRHIFAAQIGDVDANPVSDEVVGDIVIEESSLNDQGAGIEVQDILRDPDPDVNKNVGRVSNNNDAVVGDDTNNDYALPEGQFRRHAENNEIEVYVSGRWVSTSQAIRRMMRKPIHRHWPPVMLLPVHLERLSTVVIGGEDSRDLQNPTQEETSKLLAFFRLCRGTLNRRR